MNLLICFYILFQLSVHFSKEIPGAVPPWPGPRRSLLEPGTEVPDPRLPLSKILRTPLIDLPPPQLVSDPRGTLEKLYSFIDEPLTPQVMAFALKTTSGDSKKGDFHVCDKLLNYIPALCFLELIYRVMSYLSISCIFRDISDYYR